MLIINANIITMEEQNYEKGYLWIKEGKIAAVGDMQGLTINDDEVLDAHSALLLPGFIDCHCHIGMWDDGLGFEGDDGNEETDPITPQLRAIDAVNSFDDCFGEAVAAGITSVLTGPGSANPIAGQWLAMKTAGSRIDDMLIKSPVGMKFALGENPKSVYNSKSQTPVTRMAIAALIREQLKKAKRYMEDWADYEQDLEADEPEYDIKCEALVPVLKGEIKAFFHAHRADDIFTAIRIAKEFNLDYVLIHATEGYKIAAALKAENAQIIAGPIICDRSKPELKGLTPGNPASLKKAGLDVAICTDHPVIPIQYLPISAAVSCKAGLDYEDALKAITIHAAKITGIDQSVGSIKVGKDADLLLFRGNPLDIMSEPFVVIIDGNIVKSI